MDGKKQIEIEVPIDTVVKIKTTYQGKFSGTWLVKPKLDSFNHRTGEVEPILSVRPVFENT